jgi:hypothetical protein
VECAQPYVQALATCGILKVMQYFQVIHMQPFSWETFGKANHKKKQKTSAPPPSPPAPRGSSTPGYGFRV